MVPKTRDEIRKKILEIIDGQGLTPKEGGAVTEATRFKEDLDIDSLNSVEIVMETEDAFDITIPDGAAEKWLTIGQAIDYVNVTFNPTA